MVGRISWFEELMGFTELSPEYVRSNVSVDGTRLKSSINGKEYICGILETPSLGDLLERIHHSNIPKGNLSVREVVDDVKKLHRDESNAGALFQVASQFNLLEMVSPNYTPEAGVEIYENDPTQGPACAIAAGAGTIYRNYFVLVNGKIGQSAINQIDCLVDLGDALGNSNARLWEMRNGYVVASALGLSEITETIESSSKNEIDDLRKLLRIGVQSNTQVTISDSKHLVSQSYCSALPVAYSLHRQEKWERFATLVLEASYEATLCSSVLNAIETGSNRVYLTLLGAGAFGNKVEWIEQAIDRALRLFVDVNLDVAIVSHGTSKKWVRKLVDRFK